MRKRYNKLKLNFHEGYFGLRQTSSKLKENYRGANLIRVLFYFPYLISILLLNGCSPQQTVLPSPQPKPWFVKSSMPPDGSTIIYKPISEICIEIRTSAIVQSGDHFNDAEAIIDKLSLTFNGQNISISPEVSHELASTEIEYPDGSLASYVPEYFICWDLPSHIGVNQALIEIKQTSGHILAYQWHFIIEE